jgi:2-polyprenyl-3-methyl-5-hydroxy-6-metoxy-1,4-benzoquinol methylase
LTKARAFAERAAADLSATYVVAMCVLGDRLGLFTSLARKGPATSAELAERTGTRERYVREWLRALSCAGYLTYDGASGRFMLPAEHAPVLAQEAGSSFLGAEYHQLQALLGNFDPLSRAFREGGGVPASAYDASFWDGLDRSSAIYCEQVLLGKWIPALPGVRAALERGIAVADVGCGRGRAICTLAQAFPKSRFTGYDAFAPNVERARTRAAEEGLGERTRFVVADVASGLPERQDAILSVNVVHDAAHPLALLRAVRAALHPGGAYLCVEPLAPESLEDCAGPQGAYMYGTSVLYCLTTALAAGGEGTGTCGMPESRLRQLCLEAGFAEFERLPLEDVGRGVYVARV